MKRGDPLSFAKRMAGVDNAGSIHLTDKLSLGGTPWGLREGVVHQPPPISWRRVDSRRRPLPPAPGRCGAAGKFPGTTVRRLPTHADLIKSEI